ncbi:MAG: FkbM family methyltransferase [Paracoccaceae bacterium]|nr:FkbM family methyltransferase [Paracoccaceae bacterium]
MSDFLTSAYASIFLKSTIDNLNLFLDRAIEQHSPSKTHSQLRQDQFALWVNGFKKNGYFVEFGATNDRDLSNSYLLEHGFGWDGILAEPDPNWHSDLLKNRNCKIELDCVWNETGRTLKFDAASVGELSTISEFAKSDHMAKFRRDKETIDVSTISLLDLLRKHNAPKVIDYLSVDTEGSELEILSAFDFGEYSFNFVSIEHNYTRTRKPLKSLMENNGYRRVFISHSRFDDWYVPIESHVV